LYRNLPTVSALPLQARDGADDGSRWRGPDCPPWLSCREKEWVRRLGASPPMRMSASWFGSWTHRIQGCGAIDPRPESGLPSDRHPDRTKRAVVLEAVKVWPGKGAVRRKVGATANLDSSCARRLCNTAGRGEETGHQVEQRNRSRKQEREVAALKPLDKKGPIQGGLASIRTGSMPAS
jgi:hypothetical protein